MDGSSLQQPAEQEQQQPVKEAAAEKEEEASSNMMETTAATASTTPAGKQQEQEGLVLQKKSNDTHHQQASKSAVVEAREDDHHGNNEAGDNATSNDAPNSLADKSEKTAVHGIKDSSGEDELRQANSSSSSGSSNVHHDDANGTTTADDAHASSGEDGDDDDKVDGDSDEPSIAHITEKMKQDQQEDETTLPVKSVDEKADKPDDSKIVSSEEQHHPDESISQEKTCVTDEDKCDPTEEQEASTSNEAATVVDDADAVEHDEAPMKECPSDENLYIVDTHTTPSDMSAPPTPPPAPSATKESNDVETITPVAPAAVTETDGAGTPKVSTAISSASEEENGENAGDGSVAPITSSNADDGSNKFQTPPRSSAKTSSPQSVLDFDHIKQADEDAQTHHTAGLFPVSTTCSPQRDDQQPATISSTNTNTASTTTGPSSKLDQKDATALDSSDDEAKSFLPPGLQVTNKVKDIYRPNEKKDTDAADSNAFAELAKQNSFRNRLREETNVRSIRQVFEKEVTVDSPKRDMGLESFYQQQQHQRQQSHEQEVETLATMHRYSKEVLAEHVLKSAHGEVIYSHLDKVEESQDQFKDSKDIPSGLDRLETSAHRRSHSLGEIDGSHTVGVDGVDRSDWMGPSAMSADAGDDAETGTGIVHPDCKATDYRGMIFVVHHQEGLMLLRADKRKSLCSAVAPKEDGATGDSGAGVSATTVSATTAQLGTSDGNGSESLEDGWGLEDVGAGDEGTLLYQLPGGRLSQADALVAAQKSSDPQKQLFLAARAGAARQLYESTGLDVRSQLKDLIPAILKPDRDTQLPNEHQNSIFFFLNVSDKDFVKPEERDDGSVAKDKDKDKDMDEKEQPAAEERLLLKLSMEHTGFVFEKEPAKAAELLKSDDADGGTLSSEALELLTQQQQTLANKSASSDDKKSPFTLDRFMQKQYHPTLGDISICSKSVADEKDGLDNDDKAHLSENEEIGSFKDGKAVESAGQKSPTAGTEDPDLQKTLNSCACCVVM